MTAAHTLLKGGGKYFKPNDVLQIASGGSSGTATSVVNYTGAGVLHYACILNDSANNNSRISVSIDGESPLVLTHPGTTVGVVLGSYGGSVLQSESLQELSPVDIPFFTSLTITVERLSGTGTATAIGQYTPGTWENL